MPYRIYIDESGDHSYKNSDDINFRYLCLVGSIIKNENDYILNQEFNKIKNHFWGDDSHKVVFHRKDIIHKKKNFVILLDEDKRRAFDEMLLNSLKLVPYKVTSVLIDKKTHLSTYVTPYHPYNYCLVALIERYLGLLRFWKDYGVVCAESRGSVEDGLLQETFSMFFHNGNEHFAKDEIQSLILSEEIIFYTKKDRMSGIELSDIIAAPIRQFALVNKKLEDRIIDGFTKELLSIVERKFNRRFSDNAINGYGIAYLSCLK